MKKNYNTPAVDFHMMLSEEIMSLTSSGEYDEKSNVISWDDLTGSLGI